MRSKLACALLSLVCVAVVAAGCGGGSSKSSTSASEGTPIKGGSAVTPAMASNPSGNVTWCIGKDTTGAFSQVVNSYNQSHPKVHVKLIELPTSADQQHSQLVQREQAKSSECDVLGMDVIWTAEFAAQGWLRDVTPAINARKSEFIPSTLGTAQINGKYWAVPFNTNAGFLYYNTSKIKQAPTTWQQAYQMAKTDGGLGYQGARYEGLTVNFLELLYSNGGSVLSSDGKKATIDSPQAQQVLSFMQQGVKNGAVPKSNSTWMEEESRNAFQNGKVAMLRNWPYVYALADKKDGSSQVAGKFAVAPLPGLNGPGVSSLGGHALGISTYAKNKKTAVDFINFYTSKEANTTQVQQASLAPVWTSIYDDASLQKQLPYLTTLKASILGAQARPKVVRYGDATLAIQDAAYGAMQGTVTVDQAVQQLQDKLTQLTSS